MKQTLNAKQLKVKETFDNTFSNMVIGYFKLLGYPFMLLAVWFITMAILLIAISDIDKGLLLFGQVFQGLTQLLGWWSILVTGTLFIAIILLTKKRQKEYQKVGIEVKRK